MDDSLKTLDLSAEGTVSVPPVVVPIPPPPPPTPQPSVVASTQGPTDKKPMGKKTKIVTGFIVAIVTIFGLTTSLFLVRQRQNLKPRAEGNCRCSGTSIICEKPDGGFDYVGESDSCRTGADFRAGDNGSTIMTDTNSGTQTVIVDNNTNQNTPNDKTPTAAGQTNGLGSVPTLSLGYVLQPGQIDPTKKASYCGGLGQGGCDNKKGEGFGCVPPLVFCTNNGSCQSDCPVLINKVTNTIITNYASIGPANSNPEAYKCLTTGVDCGTGGAVGLTQLPTNLSDPNKINPATASNASPTDATRKIVWDGGGITQALCTTTTTNSTLCEGAASCTTSAWCGGVPEAPANQPLLKSGFCGIAGIANGKTCDQQFKDNFGFNITGGCQLKASGTASDSNAKLANCSYSGSTIEGFSWTWDLYKGFTIIGKLGEGAQYARYVCKNQTNLTQGCNCPQTTADKSCVKYTGADALAFNWSECGVQQIDIDVPTTGGNVNHVSRNIINENCGGTPPTTTTTTNGGGGGGGGGSGGGSNPTPTPTTNNPSYACYQLAIMRNGNQISASNVQVGDNLLMRGFATASNTTVSRIRFVISINGVAQAPQDVNASLIGSYYQADLPYTITQAASYSVVATPISP